MAVMHLSQTANYLDSGSKVEVADIRNYSTFQIVDCGGLNDLRLNGNIGHYHHDFVDLDLCWNAYYHYHVGCIFNLYYFNNFDYYLGSRYFFDYYHFSGHFCDSDHYLLLDFDDHPFLVQQCLFCFWNYQNTERLDEKISINQNLKMIYLLIPLLVFGSLNPRVRFIAILACSSAL
jgi:hypothetical protein